MQRHALRDSVEVHDQRLFDRYMVMQWSAATRPTRGDDSIWLASFDAVTQRTQCTSHATRATVEHALIDELSAASNRSVFLGVDFPLGFPAGYAQRIASRGANFRATWAAITDAVDDDISNADNRFAAASRLNERSGSAPGPFWGCPADETTPALPATAPSSFGGLAEYRLTERRLRAAGRPSFSVWQLHGSSQAGRHAMLGIPMISRLVEHSRLGGRVRVWPFETGCDALPTRTTKHPIVIGEMRPSLFDLDVSGAQPMDAGVVLAASHHLAELDRTGRLAKMFAPDLSRDEAVVVEREEGWILWS